MAELKVNEATFWKERPHLVVAVDGHEYGYATLTDIDGETVIVDQRHFDCENGLVRDCAQILWDELSK